MSTLIILLPARNRAGAASTADVSPGGDRELAYVLSHDGLTPARQGLARPQAMPRADNVVAVMASSDISWHQVTVPKAPAARMRAALASMLEDAILADPDDVHLAVAPQSKVGQPTWVAVVDHTWLTAQLMVLEKAKMRVDRVVPAVAPDDPPALYFTELAGQDGAEPDGALHMQLTWSSIEGVSTWPAAGALARSLLPDPLPPTARFFATPAVASPAERWLGRAVTVLTPTEQALSAARSLWNLLQFELTPRSKGLRAVTDQWRVLMGPQWRPARVGLVALVLAQVLGLNLWAFQQQRLVKQKKQAMDLLLKDTHPQVQAVLDAPVQMQRETEALRAMAGQPGDNDLEALMSAVAGVWPAEKPTGGIQYDGSSLTLMPPAGWTAAELESLKGRLSDAGLRADVIDGRLVVSRAPQG